MCLCTSIHLCVYKYINLCKCHTASGRKRGRSRFLIYNIFIASKRTPRNPPIRRQLRGSPLPPHTLRFGENSLFPSLFPTPEQAAGPLSATRSRRGRAGPWPPVPASGPAACTGLCPPGSPAPGTPAGSAPRRPPPLLPPANRGTRDIGSHSHPGDASATSGVKIPSPSW